MTAGSGLALRTAVIAREEGGIARQGGQRTPVATSLSSSCSAGEGWSVPARHLVAWAREA
jgi:hypothetical protein